MPLVSIICGIILIPLGLVVFQVTLDQTGVRQPTPLIPTGLGVLLVILGGLAYRQGMRKHAMHTAAMVGVFGVLGGGYKAVPGLVTYLSEGQVKSVPALVGQSLTMLICLIFVILCVNSFIQARRRQRQAAQG
jgi:hypothetical protein